MHQPHLYDTGVLRVELGLALAYWLVTLFLNYFKPKVSWFYLPSQLRILRIHTESCEKLCTQYHSLAPDLFL